jgi:ABC-type multidrug transport system permease subunit
MIILTIVHRFNWSLDATSSFIYTLYYKPLLCDVALFYMYRIFTFCILGRWTIYLFVSCQHKSMLSLLFLLSIVIAIDAITVNDQLPR